mmetsp:Transcript_16979/g.13979  ORF Transcript_16979/g.13979 Transcript_16979/m.13979 type:complete len:205 (-) Transcript_16979:423-1037(-)
MYNFCDIYLEMTKPVLSAADNEQKQITLSVLWHMLEIQFRLIHPMMPFISEELYQRLPFKPSESICIAEFPNEDLLAEFESVLVDKQINSLMAVVKSVRSVKSSLDYKNSKPDAFIYFLDENAKLNFPSDYLILIKTLAKCEKVEITTDEHPSMLKSVVDTSTHVYVSIADGVNLTEEVNKMSKQVAIVSKFVEGLKLKIDKKG